MRLCVKLTGTDRLMVQRCRWHPHPGSSGRLHAAGIGALETDRSSFGPIASFRRDAPVIEGLEEGMRDCLCWWIRPQQDRRAARYPRTEW